MDQRNSRLQTDRLGSKPVVSKAERGISGSVIILILQLPHLMACVFAAIMCNPVASLGALHWKLDVIIPFSFLGLAFVLHGVVGLMALSRKSLTLAWTSMLLMTVAYFLWGCMGIISTMPPPSVHM